MSEIKKYLNRDGLEDYNSLLPHSAGAMQEYVDTWLSTHPETTTTVQDGSVTAQKLAAKCVTREKLADDVTNLLAGMMLIKETQGAQIAVNDAWSIEPITLAIEGESTQAGTPTPENPIPIVSFEALAVSIHASSAGTADYGNWPVSVPLGQYALKSVPDGTCDALTLSYLNPSTREGWSWYARNLVQMVGVIDLGTLTWNQYTYSGHLIFRTARLTTSRSGLCTSLAISNTNSPSALANNELCLFTTGWSGNGHMMARADAYSSAAAFKTAMSGVITQYKLSTPIITQFDPIELPVLPAPICNVWSDPTTGLKMSYMRNANLVISDIEQAIADL